MAVGYYSSGTANQTLIEEWDGSSWSIVASPNVGGGAQDDYLNGVSCESANFCMAAGWYSNGSTLQTLIEKWDGDSWSIVSSPNVGGSAQFNILTSVSCVSAGFCMAAGSYQGVQQQTLIEEWHKGSWKIVSSPNGGPSSTTSNQLNGVSCESARFCMAVGNADYQTVIERWDGTSWSIVNSPSPDGSYNPLTGVSCSSARFCMAAGGLGSPSQTLIEEWDGTSWSVVSSPNPNSGDDNVLKGVGCSGAGFCLAVGQWHDNSGWHTLVEAWDGSNWSMIGSPNPSPVQNDLGGVDCSRATFCMAVGNYQLSSGPAQTLVEEWR